MKTVVFTVGDSYPNLKGTIEWSGSLITSTITGVMVANGNTTGAFTGPVELVSFDSENPTKSTWSWKYDVSSIDDTDVAGAYELVIQVTHDSGEIENVIPDNPKVIVGDC